MAKMLRKRWCGRETFDEFCGNAWFLTRLKRIRVDGVSISILLDVDVDLGNIASAAARKVNYVKIAS